MPSWIQSWLPLVVVVIGGAIAWGVLTTRVDDHQRAIDGLYARISGLDGTRDRIGGLEERVTSAAQRAVDAKELARELLDDRLAHAPCAVP